MEGKRGCCNANVVVNSDLGGAAWHHACNFVVFDAAFVIPAAAWASLKCVCSHAILVHQFVLGDMECSGPVMRAAWQHGMLAATGGVSASGVVTLSVAVSADNTSFF
ncbi:hypothetical protein Tco_1300504 [Tanacetum coccineum]